MATEPLTARQLDTLRIIAAYSRKHGYPPGVSAIWTVTRTFAPDKRPANYGELEDDMTVLQNLKLVEMASDLQYRRVMTEAGWHALQMLSPKEVEMQLATNHEHQAFAAIERHFDALELLPKLVQP
jgi:hypothetical protein